MLAQLDRIGMTREEEPLMEAMRAAITKATDCEPRMPDGYALAVAVAAHFADTDAPLGKMARDFLAKATGADK